MPLKRYKFVVVGGGSAGIISATYLKKYWGDEVEVVLLYDRSIPGIGVGESLTPIIYDYLNYVGITRDELVENVNATVKLGLKFKGWTGKGSEYIHTFTEPNQDYTTLDYNVTSAYDIINNQYEYDITYDDFYFDQCKIPGEENANQSLHIDAVEFSKYAEEKFKDDLTIIDGNVQEVVRDGEDITHLVLKDGQVVEGDFFVDASGFKSILFNNLDVEWEDKSDWLPLDRCIPNPLPYKFDEQPPYTTAEASDEGWILQVPLSDRWGTGYLYSSKFCSDEQAFKNFEKFINVNYDTTLNNTEKVLKFKSGYWKEQWVGNCIAVGLSSGFTEPLEATNIHHTIFQIQEFTRMFNFKVFDYDVRIYNNTMNKFYEDVYLYLRFCYANGRKDTDFWKYMNDNTPKEVVEIEEKISNDIINFSSFRGGYMFSQGNFTKVAYGLGKIDKKRYKEILEKRNMYNQAKSNSSECKTIKSKNRITSVSHKEYINRILGKIE